MAGEAALCLLGLGDLAAAERAAERVIRLCDRDRVRSRVFGELTLARVLVQAGRPDEAAARGRAACHCPQGTGVAGVTSDDAAQFAHLAEGNARQARKRIAADVLIRDEAGHVLLVDPTYKDGWDLPGGMVEANESPRIAAARELGEELGLAVPLGRVLAIEWVPPYGPWDDQLVFVFDGATLPAERIVGLRTGDPELARLEFVPITEAAARMRPDVWRRLQRAHTALRTGITDYHERTS